MNTHQTNAPASRSGTLKLVCNGRVYLGISADGENAIVYLLPVPWGEPAAQVWTPVEQAFMAGTTDRVGRTVSYLAATRLQPGIVRCIRVDQDIASAPWDEDGPLLIYAFKYALATGPWRGEWPFPTGKVGRARIVPEA
jgi:hypothetical protein